MANSKKQSGFTVVELMFAMVFIAFILIFTTLSIIELVRQYNRGVETKVINQSGRSIIDLMTRDIARSGSLSLHGSATGVGMLCTDGAVYAWNGIDAPPPEASGPLTRNTYITDKKVPISLVRIEGKPGVCQGEPLPTDPPEVTAGKNNDIPYPYGTTDQNVTTELLARQAQVLSIRIQPVNKTGGKLYRLYVALGSSRSDAYTIDGGKLVCKPIEGNDACARADFSTTVYMP